MICFWFLAMIALVLVVIKSLPFLSLLLITRSFTDRPEGVVLYVRSTYTSPIRDAVDSIGIRLTPSSYGEFLGLGVTFINRSTVMDKGVLVLDLR